MLCTVRNGPTLKEEGNGIQQVPEAAVFFFCKAVFLFGSVVWRCLSGFASVEVGQGERGRLMGRVAVAVIVSLWVVPMSILVNRVVPEPFMVNELRSDGETFF